MSERFKRLLAEAKQTLENNPNQGGLYRSEGQAVIRRNGLVILSAPVGKRRELESKGFRKSSGTK